MVDLSTNSDVAIWGGRWQPPHIGHEYVFKWLLTEYKSVCISIVNPDPASPPMPPEAFPRFNRELNPLSFYDRMLLWRDIADAAKAVHRVQITPSWHPRLHLHLEDAFLPPRARRIWIVPNHSDEEWMKIQDLEKLGERVRTDIEVPKKLLGVSGAEIRQRRRKHENIHSLLPVSLRHYGPAYFEGGISRPERRVTIVPFCNDYTMARWLARLATWQRTTELVVALCVHINEATSWWFRPENQIHALSYYERYKLIVDAMSHLDARVPIVVPIFVQAGSPLLLSAMLPNIEERDWLIDSASMDLSWLVSALSRHGESIQIADAKEFPDSKIEQAENYLIEMLKLMHFDHRLREHQDNTSGTGTRFGDGTVVFGDIVNIEGDQRLPSKRGTV